MRINLWKCACGSWIPHRERAARNVQQVYCCRRGEGIIKGSFGTIRQTEIREGWKRQLAKNSGLWNLSNHLFISYLNFWGFTIRKGNLRSVKNCLFYRTFLYWPKTAWCKIRTFLRKSKDKTCLFQTLHFFCKYIFVYIMIIIKTVLKDSYLFV